MHHGTPVVRFPAITRFFFFMIAYTSSPNTKLGSVPFWWRKLSSNSLTSPPLPPDVQSVCAVVDLGKEALHIKGVRLRGLD